MLRRDLQVGSSSPSPLRWLSAHIAQQYSTMTTKIEAHRGGLSQSRLNRVVEFINANLGDNLELSVLAEVAGVNLYHFARAFRQSTGETPHQYVLRRRIERAKEFLRHSQSSVIEAGARAQASSTKATSVRCSGALWVSPPASSVTARSVAPIFQSSE